MAFATKTQEKAKKCKNTVFFAFFCILVAKIMQQVNISKKRENNAKNLRTKVAKYLQQKCKIINLVDPSA